MSTTLSSLVPYISSGLGLAAFIITAAVWIYKHNVEERGNLIKTARPEDRAQLVQDALEFLHIETADLTKEQKYHIALEQIKNRSNRFRLGLIFATIVAILASTISLAAILSEIKGDAKIVISEMREGNPESQNRQAPPNLNNAKKIYATSVDQFRVSGHASIKPATKLAPGYFDVIAKSIDNRDNIGIEYINDVNPHYFLSVNLGGDADIGTLEIQGLGPDNEKIHFIVDNRRDYYFLWAGESNQQSWKILPVEKGGDINNFGIYQDGRYAVLFLNGKRVASFDTLKAQRAGKVGIAFKRQRKQQDGFPLTNEHRDAKAYFSNFTIYEFGDVIP